MINLNSNSSWFHSDELEEQVQQLISWGCRVVAGVAPLSVSFCGIRTVTYVLCQLLLIFCPRLLMCCHLLLMCCHLLLMCYPLLLMCYHLLLMCYHLLLMCYLSPVADVLPISCC